MMVMLLRKAGLAYFPVPKVASTSIKHFLFEVENGFEFRSFVVNNKTYYIYDFIANAKFDDGIAEIIRKMYAVCVVRDPIERLRSAYANRVLRERVLSEQRLSKWAVRFGASPDPDFSTFCDRFALYRKYSPDIRLHTEPLHYFLGKRPGFYQEIFRLRDLDKFQDKINLMCGTKCRLPRIHQTSGIAKTEDIKDIYVPKIRKIYEEDYDIYGGFF